MILPQRTDVDPKEIWAPIVSVFLANVVLYFVAQILKDNSIVDITWGIMHVIPNIVIWSINGNMTESSIAANVLILVWALRMAFYNIARHKKEDWRFAQMRQEWEQKGTTAYYLISYFGIFFTHPIF